MKIQNLAVIFIIIILPISIILTSYVHNQTKTLSLQASYDTKLNNATHDALKAFQLNTINSDTSDLANSKLRDIEASANAFFTSIASNFNMAGYNQDVLKDYVPALVYTMYDGYYIYSPYTNTLDDTNSNEWIVNETTGETQEFSDAEILDKDNGKNTSATYKNGEKVYGLKPYIYYSCRYRPNANSDFVITYSLDNYITIQGVINNNWVFDEGYLLDNITVNADYSNITYRGVQIILNETIEEAVYNPENNKVETYECITINGVKYYHDTTKGEWFTLTNGERTSQGQFNVSTTAAKEYYKEAYLFTKRVREDYGLSNLTGKDAVDEEGQPLFERNENGEVITGNYKLGNYKIFASITGQSIEDPNSNFNQQRLAVIRYSIEKNLSIAIANYNNYTGVTTNFQMPVLKENEWEDIINNVSIISFLQGLNIGGKVYNGYSIITNNKNKEFVGEDFIYILTTDNQYHQATDKDLLSNNTASYIETGVLNIDFEVKSVTGVNGNTVNYMPKQRANSAVNQITGCYSSIVSQTNVNATDNMYEYISSQGDTRLARVYFTALGRERYGLYKTNVNPNERKKTFGYAP